MSAGTLLFLATEDWFVASHFQPMVRRALDDGWRVAIAARRSGAERLLTALGASFHEINLGRGTGGVFSISREVRAVQRLIERICPDVVHAIALKPATLASMTRGPPLVLAVTGLGWLSTSSALKDRLARRGSLALIGGAIRSGRAVGLFENQDDADAIGGLPRSRALLSPGAGVDVALLRPLPTPETPPVRIGLVARVIRSKGVDLAVEAVTALRRAGIQVELAIAGAPDPDNPGAFQASDLEDWRSRDGVRLLGRIDDVVQFWRSAHIACLPSRGGEGLPRSLLEAAAHGRPIVTTDVPGCRDLVRDGVEGRLVQPNDATALAAAIADLAQDPERRAAMGADARRRVEGGYTIAHVQDVAAAAWRAALGHREAGRRPQ